ncbi:MAG: DUF4293 domain-containing protein [Phaeodactylibacter sp.]|nr:DUF4293 domain-containing protein [Phaeodactylibacter sp.]MCB9274639.1 DUF4293 domain-containing protein [Lewinellaceae bacterium]
MLQRIQSIFLALAAAASFGALGLPFATTAQAVQGSAIFSDGAFSVQDQIALLVLFAVAGALALASIFLFRNRNTQMRLSIFAFIANLIGIVFGVLFFMQNSNDAGESTIQDGLGAYLPVAALVFLLLAYRFIRKDDKLVRSMDRLR